MENKKTPLILLVGKSGSGKTTIASWLEDQYDLKQLLSYTTRPKRYPDEQGHIFIKYDQYMTLKNQAASTCYKGNYYCATKEQCDQSDIYIIDPHGIQSFKNNYKGDRPYIIVYLDVNVFARFYRMMRRKTESGNIFSKFIETISRIKNDKNDFYKFKDTPNIIVLKNQNMIGTALDIYEIIKNF